MRDFSKHLDRRDLLTAIWAAEFVRHLDGKAELAESPVVLQRNAERAADCADRTVDALRMLFEVEFRPLTPRELERCYMTWEEFVASCQGNTLRNEDGFGKLATADHHVSNLRVDPSGTFGAHFRPDWATHVCWYNK
jgi:hypothetical protein